MEDDPFSLKDLILGVPIFSHVDKLLNRRSEDLFILGSDEHGGDTNKLKLDKGDHSGGKESVNNVDSDPKSLGEHVVTKMHLKKPINKCCPHGPKNNSVDVV